MDRGSYSPPLLLVLHAHAEPSLRAVAVDAEHLLALGHIVEHLAALARLLSTSPHLLCLLKDEASRHFLLFLLPVAAAVPGSAGVHHRNRATIAQLLAHAVPPLPCAPLELANNALHHWNRPRRRLPRNRPKRRRANTSPSSTFHRKPPHQSFAVSSSSHLPDAHAVDAFAICAQVRRVRRIAAVFTPPNPPSTANFILRTASTETKPRYGF